MYEERVSKRSRSSHCSPAASSLLAASLSFVLHSCWGVSWVLGLSGHIADLFVDAATALVHLLANEFIYQSVRF